MHTSNIKQTILLLLLGIIPQFINEFLDSSSLLLGLLVSIFILLISNIINIRNLFNINNNMIFMSIILILYSFLQHIFVGVWIEKSYLSILPILFVLISSLFLSYLFFISKSRDHKYYYYIFYILLIILLLNIITDFSLGEKFYSNNKSIFPFGEPSHFSLYFGPFFIMIIVLFKENNSRLILITLIFIISYEIPSTTLAIYALLSLILLIKIRLSTFLLVLPLFVFVIYLMLTNEYFTLRFTLSEDSKNSTSLVYLQGIQDAYFSFLHTNGLGLGFQMLGTQPLSVAGEKIVLLMGGNELNRQDGGFLAAKIIAEFGIAGIFLLVAYLFLFFTAYTKIKKVIFSGNIYDVNYVFSLVFIYASFVEFFVRGIGYFTPSLFLFMTALFLYLKFRANLNAKHIH